MKKVLCINEKNRTMSVPKQMLEDGYTGDVDAFMNAITITLMKPGSKLEDVKRSLEIVIQDIELRLATENDGKSDADTRGNSDETHAEG